MQEEERQRGHFGDYPPWVVPEGPRGDVLRAIACEIMDGNLKVFLETIRQMLYGWYPVHLPEGWHTDRNPRARLCPGTPLELVIYRAGWCFKLQLDRKCAEIAPLKQMEPCKYKDDEMRWWLDHYPSFFEMVMNDPDSE